MYPGYLERPGVMTDLCIIIFNAETIKSQLIMKKLISSFQSIRIVTVLIFLFTICTNMNSQVHRKYFIRGHLADKVSSQPLGFATIALKRLADSTLITGVASDAEGKFMLEGIEEGKYELQISSVGYESESKIIELNDDMETGTFLLQEKSVSLSEVIITGERKRQRMEGRKQPGS
jgi:hypothetical protein